MQSAKALMTNLPVHAALWSSPAAITAGPLWILYGIFLMLEPWGQAEVYRHDLGYQLVVNAPLYWLYALPGSLALILSSLVLLGIVRRYGQLHHRAERLAVKATYFALALAVLSVVGTLTLLAPLSFAGRAFSSIFLGGAAVGIGVALPDTVQALKRLLLTVGGLGLLLLPLQPLVWALQLIPAGVAAGVVALFGITWFAVGYRLWSELHHRERRTSGQRR